MSLASDLQLLLEELDRIQPDGHLDVEALAANEFPTFCTSESGKQITFTNDAIEMLRRVSRVLYDNAPTLANVVRFEQYFEVVRQSVADCFVNVQTSRNATDTAGDYVNDLRVRVEAGIVAFQTEYTHFFPAWTLGIEASQSFRVGSITFQTRQQWLEAVNFPDQAIRQFAPDGDGAYDWKDSLRTALNTGTEPLTVNILDRDIYDFVKPCPSVLTVAVSGSERELSRQRARFVCRVALDSLSLMFDDAKLHSQLALYDEPLLPIRLSRLICTNGKLWLPGHSINLRGWFGTQSDVLDIPANQKDLIDAYGKIVDTLLRSDSHVAPDLANRWASALTWFSDGCRERNDAIALAKIASSLDVLAAGGRSRDIIKMLARLTGWASTKVVIRWPETTLADVVSRIYDYGRSQILHGTHFDQMKSFVELRSHATTLARIALRECVRRWVAYSGPDESKAFVTKI